VVPGDTPDLNLVEDLWSDIKGQKFANRDVARLDEAWANVTNGMARVCQSMLPFSLLHCAGFFSIHGIALLCKTQ
jgi:hypothetical protein